MTATSGATASGFKPSEVKPTYVAPSGTTSTDVAPIVTLPNGSEAASFQPIAGSTLTGTTPEG